MKKILFIYKYCILGGVVTQLVNRLVGLKDQYEVHFLFLEDYGGKSAFKDYPYVYVAKESHFLKNLLEQYKYDALSIIDTNEVYEWLSKCQYTGLIINEVHTTTGNIEKLWRLKELLPMQVIFTPSEYMKTLIEEHYGFKGLVPIEIVPNCINPEIFKNRFKEPGALTQEINSDKTIGKHTILWIGKLDEHKCWKEFVELADQLELEHKEQELNYMMVGGITAKQEVINTFIDKLLEYNLINKMTWYSTIDYERMQEIYEKVYKSGGVYVSTTCNESFGMTVLEAMQMGLPVVIPEVGALPELCEEHKADTLYTKGDLKDASKKIIKLLDTKPGYKVDQYYPDTIGKIFDEKIKKYLQ